MSEWDWPGGEAFLRRFPPELSTSPQGTPPRGDGADPTFPPPLHTREARRKPAYGATFAALACRRCPQGSPHMWRDQERFANPQVSLTTTRPGPYTWLSHPTPGALLREADLPAAQPAAQTRPRFPCAYEVEKRPPRPRGASQEGASPPLGLAGFAADCPSRSSPRCGPRRYANVRFPPAPR
jgi:hypothetical protein